MGWIQKRNLQPIETGKQKKKKNWLTCSNQHIGPWRYHVFGNAFEFQEIPNLGFRGVTCDGTHDIYFSFNMTETLFTFLSFNKSFSAISNKTCPKNICASCILAVSLLGIINSKSERPLHNPPFFPKKLIIEIFLFLASFITFKIFLEC
jgi:hypothetical protein